jgi:hypothetical protein
MVLWLVPPATKGFAAPSALSAGVLGLFVAGMLLPRLLRKPLEVACLSPFVFSTILHR